MILYAQENINDNVIVNGKARRGKHNEKYRYPKKKPEFPETQT